MSLFDSLKKLVIEEDPTTPAPAQGTTTPPARTTFVPTGTGIPTYQAPTTIFPTAPAITFDPEKLKELRAKVHPTSGPLILFIQTLQGLQQFIPDEITRFRAAAQTLAGQGAYETWGNVVIQQYPNVMKEYPPTEQILNTRYVQMAAGRINVSEQAPAEKISYSANKGISEIRIIAGLQEPTEGGVFIDPDGKPAKKGMSGVVFQKYPLFGHRTVLGNLMLAGTMAGMKEDQAKHHAMELMTLFELEPAINKYPAELSGGMQQRIAISQQLMNMDGPNNTYTRLMLMDEPFAALDPRNTRTTCTRIRKVADMHDTNTIIVVTHDLRAALMIGDIVWVMGRDRDAQGKVCSGGKIVRQLDLIDEGLTWHPDIEQQPNFIRIERELASMFHIL